MITIFIFFFFFAEVGPVLYTLLTFTALSDDVHLNICTLINYVLCYFQNSLCGTLSCFLLLSSCGIAMLFISVTISIFFLQNM